jgi:argonaute-like protein implicated in RNA metabolism and viral defense
MRLDEIVTLNDVLKSDQYVKLLRKLKTKSLDDINVQRIKNQIIQSWKKGMKNRKHYDSLLSEIDVNLNDVLQEED